MSKIKIAKAGTKMNVCCAETNQIFYKKYWKQEESIKSMAWGKAVSSAMDKLSEGNTSSSSIACPLKQLFITVARQKLFHSSRHREAFQGTEETE